MRIRNIVIGGFALVSSFAAIAGTANADTSVYNRYETKHVYNGVSETNVVSEIDSVSETYTDSQSIKTETYGGDVNISSVNYDGTKLTGSGYSANQVAVDPVAIITVVKQNDFTRVEESTSVDAFNKYNFSSTEYEHEV